MLAWSTDVLLVEIIPRKAKTIKGLPGIEIYHAWRMRVFRCVVDQALHLPGIGRITEILDGPQRSVRRSRIAVEGCSSTQGYKVQVAECGSGIGPCQSFGTLSLGSKQGWRLGVQEGR